MSSVCGSTLQAHRQTWPTINTAPSVEDSQSILIIGLMNMNGCAAMIFNKSLINGLDFLSNLQNLFNATPSARLIGVTARGGVKLNYFLCDNPSINKNHKGSGEGKKRTVITEYLWTINVEGAFSVSDLSEDLGYVLYSALGSFYIPSCIMVFVYIRIYFAAKRRARRGIKKPPRKSATNEQVTSFTTSPCKAGTRPMPSVPSTAPNTPVQTQPDPPKLQPSIATIEARANTANTPSVMAIPNITCDFASDVSTSEACDAVDPNYGKDTLKVSTIVTTHAPGIRASSNGTASNDMPTTVGRCRALSVGIDTDMVSEFDPSSSDSGVVSRCAVVKPLKMKLCQPIFGKKNHRKKDPQKHTQIHMHKPSVGAMELEPAIPKIQKQRDPEKEKRRIARKKEKRATLILGLIMGSFIACWLPFFFLYILTPLCTKCQIPESAFAIAFWLGYMNSALNPAIYTIFNKDFRRAFRRILFK
ncbi:alpha-2B adrenergic receptor-like [Phlebotomus argentipes]|uniref:alpha-2B adrenergic receptor-like n=1 Tax=Phlebotomus argentipes TaxID=94469 RepID=UPI002892D986|nr:alpha-2B adrenergic receptor-like [Phlebotomus argentipes]